MANFSDKLFAKADEWLAAYKKQQREDRAFKAALRKEADKYYAASKKAEEMFGRNGNVHVLADRDFKNYMRLLEMNYQERPGVSQRYRDYRSGKEVILQPSELDEFIDVINNPKAWAIED